MKSVRCPFDRVWYESKSIVIGEFICPADDPRFTDTGPIENHVLVVASRPVEIHFSRARSVVADRTRVLFYNRGTRYRREALNDMGDHCLWFAFDDDLLARLCRAPPERPYGKSTERLPLCAFLDIRSLYARLATGGASSLEVEEAAFAMLAKLLPASEGDAGSVTARQQRTVTAAEAYLAEHYMDAVRLEEVAEAAACSPFHLSRLFRRLRGTGLHQHLSELRLRDAVDRIHGGGDSLTDIALNLGYSSLSHFSKHFSDTVGISPSHFRRDVDTSRAII